MPHWTDKENWIHKRVRNPQGNDIGPVDQSGNQLTFDEMDALRRRAYKLKLNELDELSEQVGILYPKLPGEKYVNRESYVGNLAEADDFRKVYSYLDKHGV